MNNKPRTSRTKIVVIVLAGIGILLFPQLGKLHLVVDDNIGPIPMPLFWKDSVNVHLDGRVDPGTEVIYVEPGTLVYIQSRGLDTDTVRILTGPHRGRLAVLKHGW